jgi:hypothetical protein
LSGASLACVPSTHVTAVESTGRAAAAPCEVGRSHTHCRREEKQGSEGNDGEPSR